MQETLHVRDQSPTTFAWADRPEGSSVVRLYNKAQGAQWDATTAIDWSVSVDQEELATTALRSDGSSNRFRNLSRLRASPFYGWDDRQWVNYRIEAENWQISQFLHGEQAALICSAKLARSAPTLEAKQFAATQVVDEARHVEVFARYSREKLSRTYAIDGHLRTLLSDVVSDSRWDVTYLGMQILIEGLALTTFGTLRRTTSEPLLKQLLRLVLADEARHVAFGVLSLAEVYPQLGAGEIRERQELALDAMVCMRDRLLMEDLWRHLGVDMNGVLRTLVLGRNGGAFKRTLLANVIPNCTKLGLLDAGDGWLRRQLGELGMLERDPEDSAGGLAGPS